ncbi:hypothetical protein BKA64DRAFT_666183 [Cadophora sp. MPI-SDFR-AT-0126]|nr:hypothetical protein BKA64DRAFT_666183 [Leotiomycetes sp. MPI-SDFR-AT-0126]
MSDEKETPSCSHCKHQRCLTDFKPLPSKFSYLDLSLVAGSWASTIATSASRRSSIVFVDSGNNFSNFTTISLSAAGSIGFVTTTVLLLRDKEKRRLRLPFSVVASLAVIFVCMLFVSKASDLVLEAIPYGINLGISMAMLAEIWI